MESGKKQTYITWVIIAINIFYFLFLDLTGSSEDIRYMLDHGAMYVPYVLKGEYYRILTAMFMHFGINHLVNNMFILFILGAYLERALGKVKYLLFYLACGIGANLVSVGYEIYQESTLGVPMNSVSAGASGAIFGVAGGLLYIVLANKGKLEDLHSKQIAIMIVLSLYLGFQSIETDNLAHIAGAVIGFLLAVLFYWKPVKS